MSLAVYHPQSSEAQRELEMPKKSYALRNRRGYMDSTFDEGLRIVLQWMERRRQDIELLLQKELYMLRRMFYPRRYILPFVGALLPGGPSHEYADPPIREELEWLRNWLQFLSWPGTMGVLNVWYAPGY